MEEAPNKFRLLDKIRRSRAELDALLAGIDPSLMTRPGVTGDWSVKDVLAHITWHEREMLNVTRAHALVGSDLWDLPLDQRNAVIYNENKDRALKDVLDESATVVKALMQAMQTLTEEDLHDPSRFPNMPTDWQPWDLFAQNTFEHYQDHLAELQAWQGENAHRQDGKQTTTRR
jgi:hypothetical protein